MDLKVCLRIYGVHAAALPLAPVWSSDPAKSPDGTRAAHFTSHTATDV